MGEKISNVLKGEELIIKPVFTYQIYKRKEATSWRRWGGIQTKEDINKELKRVQEELDKLSSSVEFPLKMLSLTSIKDKKEINDKEINLSDVILIYAGGGNANILEKLTFFNKPVIIFIRHKSGPIYYWYETIHPLFLRKHTDEISQSNVDIEDIVIDDYNEIIWRLKALYGLKNTIGEKIIAVGGASGWGGWAKGPGRDAPGLARKKWNLEIIDFPYSELGERIKKEKNDKDVLNEAKRKVEEYLSQPNITLKTDKNFVVNSFILYKIFKDLLNEFNSNAITINECMGTIISLSKTTACLPLSLLNDEGYLAFCESDFVVIPSGILLHYISGKPVFLNDPTYPHNGVVTLAHCTAPRRMDGKNYEKAKIVTHFESDYGAAPKVEFTKGQEVTVIIPDFNEKIWTGFKGKVLDSPFFPICRSQVDIKIEGDWEKLLREMRGFHWMMAYGDYLKEIGYVLKKKKIEWKAI